jgi:CheY-like chemotaxis protein
MALAVFRPPARSPAAVAPPRPDIAWTVLVADDDADMRLYLARCLHGMGAHRILEAADGRQALHLARALLPDLIISDVVMPGLDGEALGDALKSDVQTAKIPFLLISGEPSPPRGGDGFLPKPFNATRLRTEVMRLLRGPP